VVIDNSGYYPRIVEASAKLLSRRVKQYIYISSISAYREPNPVHGDESAPLATMPDPTSERPITDATFGPLKALCERAAQNAMPGRVTVVRPGYIVGPDDNSGRFTYWPVKFDNSGKILVPGNPNDPLQIIDVRDLGEWLVKLAEDGTMGVFNATGPDYKLKWGQVIDACIEASTADPKPVPVWVNSDIIEQSIGVGAYPIWIAPKGEYAGFHNWSNEKAIKAGLKFRPVSETVRDTLAWYREQQKLETGGRTRLAGPNAEREARVWEALKQDTLKTLELLLK
jgi:2'-hydroxyisoflavone reductase